jgi:nucleotide-binding universal stress UspA family protein
MSRTIQHEMQTTRGVGLRDVATLMTVDLESALYGMALGIPTLFVPPEGHVPDKLTCVVVAHDGTPSAGETLKQAIGIAGRDGAEVVVLHVAGSELPAEPGSLPAPRFIDHAGNTWTEWRQEFYLRFINGTAAHRIRLDLVTGSAGHAISEAARRLHADLLVLGLEQVGGTAAARSVCLAAPCPVVLVRRDDHERPSTDA